MPKKKKETKVYLTDEGKIVAAGEVMLRMKKEHKSMKEVFDENETKLEQNRSK